MWRCSRCAGIALRVAAVGWLLAPAPAGAQDDNAALRSTLFADADAAYQAAREADASLLAPSTFQDAVDAYSRAEDDLQRGRALERIQRRLSEATENFQTSAQLAEQAAKELADALQSRNDARTAAAPDLVQQRWQEAEQRFARAVSELERGRVGDAHKRAAEAEALYRGAELAAIESQYLSRARAAVAQAHQDRVERYAPKTLGRAQALLQQAVNALEKDRYNTAPAQALAGQALAEAQHAANIARQVEGVEEGSGSVEDLILAYQQKLATVAESLDTSVTFERGDDQAFQQLTAAVGKLQAQVASSEQALQEARAQSAGLQDELHELDTRLNNASEERVTLVQRLEAQQRVAEQFQRIESLFQPTEAQVLRSGDDIIVRLVGLSFASGESEIGAPEDGLLSKVARAINVFPSSAITIEGHTDSSGSDRTNLELSRRRAQAVRTYLVDHFSIPGYRLSAEGYGESRPIASNDTPAGQARNRRIDVIIHRQGNVG